MMHHRYHLSTRLSSKKMAAPIARSNKPKEKNRVLLFRIFNFLLLLIQRHLYVSGFIFLFLIILGILFFSPLFQIKSYVYDMSLNNGCITKERLAQSLLPRSQVYPWTFTFYSRKNILETYRCLKDIKFSWNPIKRKILLITPISEKPYLRAKLRIVDPKSSTSSGDIYFSSRVLTEDTYYVVKDGSLVTYTDTFDVPEVVYYSDAAHQSQGLQLDVGPIMQIITYMKDVYSELVVPEVTSLESVRMKTNRFGYIYISLRSDLSKQLGSLQSVWETSTIDKAKMYSIDLRFGNPVVLYK